MLARDGATIDRGWFGRLKSSVRVLAGVPTEGSIYVGTLRKGVIVRDFQLLAALRAMDGQRSFHDLAQSSLIEIDRLLRVIKELISASLIVIDALPMRSDEATPGQIHSVSQTIAEERMSPEIALAHWRSGSLSPNGGEMQARNDFPIAILGRNRLAIALLSMLQASGFTQARIDARWEGWNNEASRSFADEEKQTPITGADVCGIVTRISDLGTKFEEFTAQVVRDAGLNVVRSIKPTSHSDSHQSAAMSATTPRLILATQPMLPDRLAFLMSDGIPHIQVSPLTEHHVEISPLVLPGRTPCLRCIALHKYQSHAVVPQFELLNSLDPAPELPTAAVAILAGAITTIAIEFADTGHSQTHYRSLSIDLFDPCNGEHIHWEPHSFCGCFGVI